MSLDQAQALRRDVPIEAPADEPTTAMDHCLLARRFWAGALGFWRRGGGRAAWLLVVGLIAVILLHIYMQYSINVWNRAIFDALQERAAGAVWTQSLVFLPLAAISVALGIGAVYLRMTTQRRWRAW